MSFRALKPRLKSTKSSSIDSTSSAQSDFSTDDHQIFDIEKLQNEIESKEKSLNASINHTLISLDANINDLKSLIDQKRPEQKIYKSSICDLWLRLKTIEQMETVSLITFLRTNQLYRTEKQLGNIHDDSIVTPESNLTNPRRSRLIHCHLCPDSDKFSFGTDFYVGFLIFSYNNQSRFILNNHHCQRGDILIKQKNSFLQTQKADRGLYDALFKWYFGRLIDEKFFGLGFIYFNNKWRFDLLANDDRDLFFYEYRIFDMYLLTHWLTKDHLAHHVQEMEIHAKTLLFEQYNLVQGKLIEEGNSDLFDNWTEVVGSDIEDLMLSIGKFHQTIEKEIEILFEETNIRTNSFSALFNQNTKS